MSRWVESVERRIAAPVDRIYALVGDPARHKDFDGSGSLVKAFDISSPVRPLSRGDWFSMDMDLRGKYAMTSTVVEAVPGERFAWQARPHKDCAKWRFMFGGRIWRYEFEPDGDTTLVRESWDLSEEPLRGFVVLGRRPAREAMRRSLDRIAALTESE
ncbi:MULTISPECIES: SRPBCC family protein [Streptomyces]|uniref:SRPBCC family protein n=1 Tax=Streptomyces cylindrosporus TaxID=2927583 RepID=A0ABS9Y443_9ACTN|nr:SRPBCC family protein [Streptomyces cylindrosporus]MCI3270721.1 SRPBCC family protein [Streptomyces cylindrosporus]